MRRLSGFGGYAAALILIAFGVDALVLGVKGRGDVRDNLARERSEGSAGSLAFTAAPFVPSKRPPVLARANRPPLLARVRSRDLALGPLML